jgi:glyoxylase-like metal-dependent hydrolase (beta-lactamase superfamily II)/DNA-binding XRE family transcriptional regulator
MTTCIPLEDSWIDVIRKARRGLGLSEADLAMKCGLQVETIISLESGSLDPESLGKIALPLKLQPARLLAMSRGEYHPGVLHLPVSAVGGVAMFTSPWNDFEVHSYLAWDARTSVAAAFDTGSDASELLQFLKKNGLKLELILLTHGHGDHVFELDRMVEATGAKAWIGKRENIEGAENFAAGKEFTLGSLRIETRSTWGHSSGGISYVIHGLERPVAIVGDALFAGSMGGPMISYEACLATNRKEIFTLPPDTLLCPGHGPLTTVTLEAAHNPFFP